jgi:hypothetical protein
MARALHAEAIPEGPGVIDSAATGVHRPSTRLQRLVLSLVALRSANEPWLVLVGWQAWAGPYSRQLVAGGSAHLVNPGRKGLEQVLRHRARISITRLGTPRPFPPAAPQRDALSPEEQFLFAIRSRFELLRGSLKTWAEIGRRLGKPGVVALAGQDVLPPERAFLLGLRAAGGRVITLEHGISGGYTQQVWSIADVLAAWGEPQAAYHRQAGPPGLRVEAVGWPRLESVALEQPTERRSWDLLHFSQPSEDLSAGGWPEAHLHALRLVDEYARLHPDRRVAIKLHPSSRANRFAPSPIQHAEIVTDPSLDLIRSARVVLVVESTTGLEAMSLGRPVLQVPPRGYVGPTEFISASQAARAVDSVDELAAATEQLLRDPDYYDDAARRGQAYAGEFIEGFGKPGSAAGRLSDLVSELRAMNQRGA